MLELGELEMPSWAVHLPWINDHRGSKAGKAGMCAKCCACCTLAPTRNAWSFVPVAGRLGLLDECFERAQAGRTALLDPVRVVSNIVKAVGEIRGEPVCIKVR